MKYPFSPAVLDALPEPIAELFRGLEDRLLQEISWRLVTSVVLNGADIVEDLFQALVQEPLIRVLLDLDQVRHTDDFVDVGEAHALGFAELYGLDFHHKINHSLLLYSTDIALYGSDLSTHT